MLNVPLPSQLQDFCLNYGSYQLPLHRGPPDTTRSLTARSLDDILRVPCASILVRVVPAPRTSDGLEALNRDEVDADKWEEVHGRALLYGGKKVTSSLTFLCVRAVRFVRATARVRKRRVRFDRR